MTLIYYLMFVTIVTFFELVIGKSPNICGTQTSCSDCLYVHDECAWCSKWDDNIQVKCNLRENLLEAGCEDKFIQTGKKSEIKIILDEKLGDVAIDNNVQTIQLKPQHFQLKIRQNEELKIKIEVSPAKNYPLDIYFLIDASFSMMDDVNTIIKLGNEIMKSLKELTLNYRLGFGAFSDKPTMPWTQMSPDHLLNPCIGQSLTCKPPYDFKHALSLTNDTHKFIEQIKEDMITGNLDNVDGGLDALMQVAACKENIGWLNDTRRIVIMASDSLCHFAGDGKLGGIITPNDGKCHLDEKGFYTHALSLDYPSISQIHKVLNQNKINVIFAVTENIKPIYDQLHELIPKFTYVGRLEEDSSNIIHLLKQGYANIISKLNLQDNSSQPLSVTYYSNCGQKNGKFIETATCRNAQIGEIYEFKVGFKFTKCPKDPKDRKQRFIIDEANLGSENIVIDVEMQCGCECSHPENITTNSTNCNHNGNEICGLCECERSWLGKYCQCDSAVETSLQLDDQCRNNGSIWKCSNRGDCVCGTCHCDPGFSGQYCECSDCDRIGGKICSGHGVCDCGECVCHPEYTGTHCECATTVETCIEPAGIEKCNGRGECQCGKCVCHKIQNIEYIGEYCETLFYGNCSQFQTCVKCSVDEQCSTGEECKTNEISYNVTKSDNSIDIEEENVCIFRETDKNGDACDYKFIYNVQMNQINVKTFPKYCNKPLVAYINFWAILVAILVLYIIILIAIKARNMYKDRVEYVQFQKNLKFEKTEMNPLYKSPNTYHEVPKEFRKMKTKD